MRNLVGQRTEGKGTKLFGQLASIAGLLVCCGCQHVAPKFTESNLPVPPSQTGGPQRIVVTNSLEPAWLQPPTQPFTLGPGDKLEIELLGEPTSKTTTVVGPDGKIYFNLLPGIDVWGKTLSQAKAALEQEMAKY